MTLVTSTTGTALPPRLRFEPTGSRRTLLDGAWWPRSADPVTELPQLVLAIDTLRGPVTRLVLNASDWDTHPHRLDVAGRVLRLGFFTSQPTGLLTARCGNGDRMDLLVVPAGTARPIAGAAMELAATANNRIHAHHLLLAAAGGPRTNGAAGLAEQAWEGEGGHLPGPARPAAPTRGRRRPASPGNHDRKATS